MNEALIIDAVRTPLGRGRPAGALADEHPVDLLAHPLAALVARTGIDPALLDDVLAGCVTQVGEQSLNIARRAVLAAGFPERVPATTIDRQCGSSQQAIHFAAQGLQAGAQDLVIAAGVESMTRVPMGTSAKGAHLSGRRLAERYPDGFVSQGVAAELIAARYGISREEQDAFAVMSQQRAATARDAQLFHDEIVPLTLRSADGTTRTVEHDEGIRESTTDGLARLRPAFVDDAAAARFPGISWSVTAGNSSQLTDGAAALLLASDDAAHRLGLTPRARVRAATVEGDDPLLMLTAIIPATRKLLARAGLTMDDVDLFEVNEAFASVVLAWVRELDADLAKVNVHGGAIALGHPLGASGARIATTLLHALEQRDARYGLQVMCEAGGLANAMLIERL